MYDAFLGLFAITLFIALPVFVILLIVRAMKKKPIKKIVQSLLLCVAFGIVCIIGGVITMPEDTQTEMPQGTEVATTQPVATTEAETEKESATAEETTKAVESTTAEPTTEAETTAERIESTTETKAFTEQELMIMQFETLGLTKSEAEEAQKIFENVGITKIRNISKELGTTTGVDGEVRYNCDFSSFNRRSEGIGLTFVIMRRKIQRIDISHFPHGNTRNMYKSLTLFEGVQESDSISLYYKKLKGYLEIDENSVGYRAVYDSSTHSVSKY